MYTVGKSASPEIRMGDVILTAKFICKNKFLEIQKVLINTEGLTKSDFRFLYFKEKYLRYSSYTII